MKKKRNKTGIILLLILAMITVMAMFVGCSSNEDASSEAGVTSEGGGNEGESLSEDADAPEAEDGSSDDAAAGADGDVAGEPETSEEEPEVVEEPIESERVYLDPDATFENAQELIEFIDSLGLTELVAFTYYNDKWTLLYDGDEYAMTPFMILSVYSYKEIDSVTINEDVNNEYLGNGRLYQFDVDSGVEHHLQMNFNFTDGTEEEITIHLLK